MFGPARVRAAGIAAGPDGDMWFTELAAGKVGRITPSGRVREFAVPTAGAGPYGIAAGPDGNMWFTEWNAGKIGRITPAGVITEYSVRSGSDPSGITTGPDRNLWFTEYATNKIGRITTRGTITAEFTVPTRTGLPVGITAGPDRSLWFTENNAGKIGRVTISGSFTEFTIPTAASFPCGIAAGPDGNMWFTENNANTIGRITPSGAITECGVGVQTCCPARGLTVRQYDARRCCRRTGPGSPGRPGSSRSSRSLTRPQQDRSKSWCPKHGTRERAVGLPVALRKLTGPPSRRPVQPSLFCPEQQGSAGQRALACVDRESMLAGVNLRLSGIDLTIRAEPAAG